MNAPKDYAEWQVERHNFVTNPAGNIALIDFVSIGDSTKISYFDATASWVAGERGVTLTGPADVTIDGKPLDGQTFVDTLGADGTPLINRGRYTADIFTLDGSTIEARVYDSESEGLKHFEKIEYYDYQPELAVQATFEPYDSTKHVAWDFTRDEDSGNTKRVPGVIQFTVDNTDLELVCFLDGEALVVTFADTTTGRESYAPGRFLRLPEPDADNNVLLDFNRSFIPPCGFSDFYSCPLPPAQNKLPVAIPAGEKRVHWRDDYR